MKQILFVCTGNTCRSSMAKAMFDNMLADDKNSDIRTESAGTAAFEGMGASENAVEAMRDMGIDLESHRSKRISSKLVDESRLILTMTRTHKMQVLTAYPQAQGKVYTLKEFAGEEGYNKDISDPFGMSLKAYKACAAEIRESLTKVMTGGQV